LLQSISLLHYIDKRSKKVITTRRIDSDKRTQDTNSIYFRCAKRIIPNANNITIRQFFRILKNKLLLTKAHNIININVAQLFTERAILFKLTTGHTDELANILTSTTGKRSTIISKANTQSISHTFHKVTTFSIETILIRSNTKDTLLRIQGVRNRSKAATRSVYDSQFPYP